MRIVVAIILLSLSIGAKLTYESKYSITEEGVATVTPLSDFPTDILGEKWQEDRQPLDEEIIRKAGVTEYLNCIYKKRRTNPFWFYVGYYNGYKLESMHQPEICFPGSGWKLENKHIGEFQIEGVPNAKFNILEFKKGRLLKLTAYTFYYEGLFQPDQSYVERGRVFGDRNFAIITIATEAAHSVEDARRGMEELLAKLLPKLITHFPSVSS